MGFWKAVPINAAGDLLQGDRHARVGYVLVVLEKGAVKHTRDAILRMERVQIGEPTEKPRNTLSVIEDLERPDRIALKVLTAKSRGGLLRVR